ncbi:hypothetical protein [Mesorhizobium cantuariense]|uniref:HNH endonuclease n=1 Tax=Mesorhizobium cantuariense TaxID=1300275 RepID=A0ABV7MT48_9HYPH
MIRFKNIMSQTLSAIGRQVVAKITKRVADPPEPRSPEAADTAVNKQAVDTTASESLVEFGASNSETNSWLIRETPAGQDIHVYHMRKWNSVQREAAALKAQRLSNSDASVNRDSARDPKSVRRRYIEAGNEVAPDEDVDHIRDLQLNGSEELSNLAALDRSVNRSFGPQIRHRIKDLPHGARINKVTIGDR